MTTQQKRKVEDTNIEHMHSFRLYKRTSCIVLVHQRVELVRFATRERRDLGRKGQWRHPIHSHHFH